ncbi:ABC transporter ATP-binding protein [Tessaracoccus sp. OS52]|uniref:ABC transporter ATP-binding protein n=1 Tax=Tessaracoccus sp. OS52 TaxID=2886691 RepID=UPI001D120E2C|nr:ABC transporter ATP-binding protein [Tessaracoccus sp. OS52]MCC2593961.1 ABC transporter ATP-binding protein [Tessaracoccus sp. OS52]
MNDVALKVDNLSAERGGVEVLSGLSFEVPMGGTMCLLGANGAGKSTAVDAICGLAKKRGGQVLHKGNDITGQSSHQIVKGGLAQVSQNRDLFPQMSVEENLILGGIASKGRKRDISMDAIFESFPVLKERMNQAAGSLSGGEQQMLAIGRALLTQPDVLLLDEPTAGLAPIMVQRVVDSIKSLATSGLTLVVIEQNVEVALATTEHIVVLRRGETVYAGTKEELGSDYRAELTNFYV